MYKCVSYRLTVEDKAYCQTLSEVLSASRAQNTVAKYNRAFSNWQIWCKEHNIAELPTTEICISRYLIHLHQSSAPYSRIETAFYAIKWKHDCLPDVKNPCNGSFLHTVLLGLKKILAKPIVKKDPITPEMLKTIVNKYGSSNNLTDIRLCTMTLISFAGFLRHDELINIRRCDVKLYASHVNIFIFQSKTDIFRQGAWVLIGATNKSTCPVNMLRRYIVLSELNDDTDESFLFRPLQYMKSQNKHVLKQGRLSYSRCLELLKNALASVGLDPKRFGLHSLRAGGASAAANLGVPDRLFKKHGRWRSETAKDSYIEDSEQSRLEVSMNLDI